MSLAGFLYRRDYGERRTTMGTVTAEPACNSVENYDLGFPEESELHYFEYSLPKCNDNYNLFVFEIGRLTLCSQQC